MPGKHQMGWPSLWVAFLLATQKKSDSVTRGGRKLLISTPAQYKVQHQTKNLL